MTTPTTTIRIAPEVLDQFKAVARAEGMTLTAWIIAACWERLKRSKATIPRPKP